MPEILAPAGNLSKLFTAFHFGADAAYVGGKDFSLRTFADNFDLDDLGKAVEFSRSVGKKVYIAVNVFPRTDDFGRIREYLFELKKIGADAVIASDLGVMNAVLKCGLSLHISTQANTTNAETVKFYRDLGAKRVVLARELSLKEIGEIRERVKDIELECFVHGAMCISYSGRCLLSNYLAGRDSNRGECVQACRWKYELRETDGFEEKNGIRENDCTPNDERKRGGFATESQTKKSDCGCANAVKKYEIREIGRADFQEIQENEKGAYILNGKDLCMINHIGELVAAGVDSFKIEGRMKSEHYVGSVVNAYRRATDDFLKRSCNLSDAKNEISELLFNEFKKTGGGSCNPGDAKNGMSELLFDELKKTGNRGYTTGFYLGEDDHINTSYSKAKSEHTFIANVVGYDGGRGAAIVEQRNRFKKGDILEVLSPDENFLKTIKVENMYGENGEFIDDAKIVQQKIYIETDLKLKKFDILRDSPK
jgi:putative protease